MGKFLTTAVCSLGLLGALVLPAAAQTGNDANAALVRLLYARPWGGDQVRAAHVLLQRGASVHTKGQDGTTVLMLAARAGDLPLLRAVLARGAEVNAKNDRGETALMAVMASRSEEKVRALLRAGAEVNAPDVEGRTPLMWAAEFKFRGGIDLLLANGADPKATNSKGHTAVVYAQGHPGLVALLKRHGAQD
jgi:uncharacterized protein